MSRSVVTLCPLCELPMTALLENAYHQIGLACNHHTRQFRLKHGERDHEGVSVEGMVRKILNLCQEQGLCSGWRDATNGDLVIPANWLSNKLKEIIERSKP